MADLPKEWIRTPDEPPYLIVKWGTIITGLIGAPLAALGVSVSSAPASATAAIERLLDAAGEAVGAFLAAIMGSLSWLLGRGSTETGMALPDGLAGFILAIVLGGFTLYGASLVVTFVLGADG